MLVTVSAAVRFGAGRGFDVPWISPDESIYALLGRSLWQTGSPSLLGTGAWGYSFLYPALVGGPLSLSDLTLGIELLQALQAVAMSTTAAVVYFWGRRPLGRALGARRGRPQRRRSGARLLRTRDDGGALVPGDRARARPPVGDAGAADARAAGAVTRRDRARAR